MLKFGLQRTSFSNDLLSSTVMSLEKHRLEKLSVETSEVFYVHLFLN